MIRRSLYKDHLFDYLPLLEQQAQRASPESISHSSTVGLNFHSIRGGVLALFASHLWVVPSILLFVEGTFDASHCWQFDHHLCDVATLGSASNHLAIPDLSYCAAIARPSLYPRRLYSTAILAIYDPDPAVDLACVHISQYPRVTLLSPPAHDLTDYWRSGGNLQTWLTKHLESE